KYNLSEVLEIKTLPSGKAVNEWIDHLDLYIQPSRTEGLPRGLIEAMNRGCPAIGSRAGGIPELLETTVIHEPGDYKKLAFLIEFLIKNQKFYQKQSQRNIEQAKNYTSLYLKEKRYNFWKEFKKHMVNQAR